MDLSKANKIKNIRTIITASQRNHGGSRGIFGMMLMDHNHDDDSVSLPFVVQFRNQQLPNILSNMVDTLGIEGILGYWVIDNDE